MTNNEMYDLLWEKFQSLHMLHVEAGQRSCGTGLSQDQVNELLLHSVLTWCFEMAESLNIPLTVDSLQRRLDCGPDNQMEIFDA